MEPKNPFSRIAATQPVHAATSTTDLLRVALARAVLERELPLEEIFADFAQASPTVPGDAAVPVPVSLERIASRVAEQSAHSPANVTNRVNEFAGLLHEGLHALWRRSWRPGMTPGQAVEIATSVVAAGATSMLGPRNKATDAGPVNPPPLIR